MAGCTYPSDIAYSVRVLCCYCSNSGPTYCNLVVQVFRYFSATLGFGITFTSNLEYNLDCYTNSDYSGLVDGRKSTGEDIYILSGGPLSHLLKLQINVALSSTEAEYMTTTEAEKSFADLTIFDVLRILALQSTCRPAFG